MTAIPRPAQTEPIRAGELGSSATATDTDRCPAASGPERLLARLVAGEHMLLDELFNDPDGPARLQFALNGEVYLRALVKIGKHVEG